MEYSWNSMSPKHSRWKKMRQNWVICLFPFILNFRKEQTVSTESKVTISLVPGLSETEEILGWRNVL